MVDLAICSLGPVLTVLCIFLILFVTFVYLFEILPILWKEHGYFNTIIRTAIGIFFLYNIIFNFLCCVFIGPGKPPLQIGQHLLDQISNDPTNRFRQKIRYCEHCKTIKPMRTHHCSVCGQCILKMDHHCPWINNCVGFRNHRFFFLFLLYLEIGSMFIVFSGWIIFKPAWNGTKSTISFLFSYLLCLGLIICLLLFLLWHTYLIFTNQSTLEWYSNVFDPPQTVKWKREYTQYPLDLGWRKNLEQFFGPNYWWWLLPYKFKPEGDGLVFPINDKKRLVSI